MCTHEARNWNTHRALFGVGGNEGPIVYPREAIKLGEITLSRSEVSKVLDEMRPMWRGLDYNLLNKCAICLGFFWGGLVHSVLFRLLSRYEKREAYEWISSFVLSHCVFLSSSRSWCLWKIVFLDLFSYFPEVLFVLFLPSKNYFFPDHYKSQLTKIRKTKSKSSNFVSPFIAHM